VGFIFLETSESILLNSGATLPQILALRGFRILVLYQGTTLVGP
jgi:hypothetical protein